MKLTKALEKAKQERQKGKLRVAVAPPQAATQTPEPEEAAPKEQPEAQGPVVAKAKAEPAPGDRTGDQQHWQPPVYTESRRFEFDPQKAAANRCVSLFPDSEEIEFYKILRTQIRQRTRTQGWNTVMVTSAQPGEGKTVTAINLAVTMAREFNQTVLLVDCDLKRQKVHQYLGIRSQYGIKSYLLDNQPLSGLITWPNIQNMTVISGGGTIRDSSELIGSPKMRDLVAEMKTRYNDRYVLFDAPPVLAGADAIAFAPLVDSIVMVVEAGRTTNKALKKALDLLPKEKLLGFVLNKAKSLHKEYYKYY